MRLLHAVETFSLAQSAVTLVSALRFRNATLAVVHVIQRIDPLLTSSEARERTDFITRFYKLQEDSARSELSSIQKLYADNGVTNDGTLLTGFTTSALLLEATRRDSDLLVLSSRGQTGIERALSQSISEGILNRAPQSILVAKGDLPKTTPIRALLATDHSDYCNRAITRLLEFLPRGIDELCVVSCFSAPLCRALASLPTAEAAVETNRWHQALTRQNEALLDQLAPLGSKLDARGMTEPPLTAIPRVLEERGINLLILGAHGHGFLERLTLGSISLGLLRRVSCSVLVLRAPTPPPPET